MYTLRLTYLLVLAFLAGVRSVALNDRIGSLQLLYQNDVAAKTNSTSAILLQSLQNYTDAAECCHLLSETLLTGMPSDVIDQLTYLNYSGQLGGDTRVYLSSRTGTADPLRQDLAAQNCYAYSLALNATVGVNCSTHLRAFCTQSATPYTASQLNAKIGSRYKLTVTSQNLSITGYRTTSPPSQNIVRPELADRYTDIAMHVHFDSSASRSPNLPSDHYVSRRLCRTTVAKSSVQPKPAKHAFKLSQ